MLKFAVLFAKLFALMLSDIDPQPIDRLWISSKLAQSVHEERCTAFDFCKVKKEIYQACHGDKEFDDEADLRIDCPVELNSVTNAVPLGRHLIATCRCPLNKPLSILGIQNEHHGMMKIRTKKKRK